MCGADGDASLQGDYRVDPAVGQPRAFINQLDPSVRRINTSESLVGCRPHRAILTSELANLVKWCAQGGRAGNGLELSEFLSHEGEGGVRCRCSIRRRPDAARPTEHGTHPVGWE